MYRIPGSSSGLIIGAAGAPGLAVTGFGHTWWILFGMITLVVGLFLFRVAQRQAKRAQTTTR